MPSAGLTKNYYSEAEIERAQRRYELLFGFHEENGVMTLKELAARLREGMEANNWRPVQEVIAQLEAEQPPPVAKQAAADDEDEPEPEEPEPEHQALPRTTPRHPVRGRRK